MDHSSRAHAILSASGSSRWMNCTPSARLEDDMPDSESVFAREGTLAHELSELRLRRKLGMIDMAEYRAAVEVIAADEMYDTEMEEEVDKYVQFVIDTYMDLKAKGLHPHIQIESRLDFSDYVPEGFGTGDTLIAANNLLYVIDLKYGKGVQVSAVDNPQLKLYAIGALKEYELSDDIQEVHMVIVQPRLDNISTEIIERSELLKWGEEQVKPQAIKAINGEGETKTGTWCKFCKVAPTCKALRDKNIEVAKVDFETDDKPENLLTDKELLAVYGQIDQIQSWINAVKNHVYNTALDGKAWEGFKLVSGRSNRKISDEALAEEALQKAGLSEEDYVTKKLKGITALEKTMGKKKFEAVLSDLIIKPQGSPTLVHESDKRPALGSESAKADFAE